MKEITVRGKKFFVRDTPKYTYNPTVSEVHVGMLTIARRDGLFELLDMTREQVIACIRRNGDTIIENRVIFHADKYPVA